MHADGGLVVLESTRSCSITLNYRPPDTRGLSRSTQPGTADAIFDCLEELRLTWLLDRRPIEMDRSDLLFLALAQAYLRKPRFLTIDEPFPGLSGAHLQHCMAILRRFRDAGTGILVTDHNPRAILEIADTVSILTNGVIAYSGTTHEARLVNA